MPIYFIYAEKDNVVKIGFAKSVSKRLIDLQTFYPFPLRCVRLLKGDCYGEKVIHRHFEAYRMKGEWFRVEGKLQEYLKNDLAKDFPLTYRKFTGKGFIRQISKHSWQIQLYKGGNTKGNHQRYFETVRGIKERAVARLEELLLQTERY